MKHNKLDPSSQKQQLAKPVFKNDVFFDKNNEGLTLQACKCSEKIIEVVPAVMDVLRKGMLRHEEHQRSVPQFRCLGFIARSPGSTMGAIAASMGVTLPTVSAMIDRLIRAGFVTSKPSVKDRRCIELHITTEGLAQIQQARLEIREDVTQLLLSSSLSELEELAAALDTLGHYFYRKGIPA
jgi:DNA-binding MarR family transcriptional regulator